jgi:glycosyltransferase involved in cell wall biosynthesis
VANALREEFFKPPGGPPPDGKCILLNIGVISERKRQVDLLEQAGQWHRAGLNFELQFIGQADAQDPYAITFMEKLREAEAKGYARHSGFMKTTAELIARFDAAHGLVHCPSEEAFGLVVAEAMARELKFFGSQAGGIVDIATGMPGAELFGVEDWEALGTAITNWMRAGHPQASGAAQAMRERYHPRVIAQRHLEIYREVLAKPS